MSRGEYRVGSGYVVGAAFYIVGGFGMSVVLCPLFAHNLTRDLATPTNPELQHREPMQRSTFTGGEIFTERLPKHTHTSSVNDE